MKPNKDDNEILNAFLEDFATSGQKALEKYVADYPDLEETLYERAAMARMFSQLPEPELTREEEEKLNLKASSVVQSLLFELKDQRSTSASPTVSENETLPLESLLERTKQIGESLDSAAAKLRLSGVILKQLDKRRVRVASIPSYLFTSLAELLQTRIEEVQNYFSLEPAKSGGFYKSDTTPTAPAQSEFADVVKYDADLGDADKEFWLALPTADKK